MEIFEIIRVEKSPSVSGEPFWTWLKEANAKLGHTGEDYLYIGNGPWEFIRVHGHLYRRELGSQEHLFVRVDTPHDDDTPDIICECGNTYFSLTYGNYELKAKCSKCGLSDTVYDG